MQTRQLSLVFSLLLTLCLFQDTQAQQAGRIESMKLLTPNVGWAATSKKLFWTTDGGSAWKDITPKLDHKEQRVSSVFFLDASKGWALLSCGDDKDPIADDVCFEFAMTADADENWSIVHPKISDPGIDRSNIGDGVGTYSGATFLNFADPQHGWAILKKSYGLQRSEGEMLRTADGGATWTQLSGSTLPIADAFRFEGPKDGWMVDGRQGDLYVSHDAGNSWQEAPLPKPASIGPDAGVSYDLPVFVNEHRGLLLARYAVGPLMGPDLSTLALFATGDGGKSWKEERILSKLPEIYSSDLAGSILIAAHSERVKAPQSASEQRPAATKLSLYTLGPNQDQTSNTVEVSSQGAVIQLSFSDGDQGWADLSDRLFATRDAGKTWVDITPVKPAPGYSGGLQPHIGRSLSLTVGASNVPDASSTVSTHLGFDGYNVPTIPQMTTWMASSPFYDVYIYLPKSPNRHNDPILVSTKGPGWVSSIEGQGWGVVPVWFGLQSNCDKRPISRNTLAPRQQRLAHRAQRRPTRRLRRTNCLASARGSSSSTSRTTHHHSTCSLADGFVSEIGFYGGYSAGVYANPAPITSDISQVSPAPSAIWITKTPPKTKPFPQVTIWNLGVSEGANGSPNLWPNGQRMHQFLINTNAQNAPNATWGGVPLSIDYDIDNAPVVNANTFVKTYTYGTPTNIDCAGEIATFQSESMI